MTLTHAIRILALCAVLATFPRTATAQELGITPNHVYGIWDNINDAVLALSEVSAAGEGADRVLRAMKPKPYSGLTPAEALAQVVVLRNKIDVLKNRGDMPLTRVLEGNQTRGVTASMVFLNSGYVLDSLVEWMISETNRDFLMSRFYTPRTCSGKTSSDVVGLAERAVRRFTWPLENG